AGSDRRLIHHRRGSGDAVRIRQSAARSDFPVTGTRFPTPGEKTMNLNFTMVAQGLAFFAFIWFTVKFIWPPLLRAIDTRQRQIADGLAAAERGKQDLELASKRAAEELQRARALQFFR